MLRDIGTLKESSDTSNDTSKVYVPELLGEHHYGSSGGLLGTIKQKLAAK